MSKELCVHGRISPIAVLEALHYNQGGTGRHRCPICSYEFGFNIGSSDKWNSYEEFCMNSEDSESCSSGNRAPIKVLLSLGENQGDHGRHKCTICAFKAGFNEGLRSKSLGANIFLEKKDSPEGINLKNESYFNGPFKTDFIKREIENRNLGLLGELAVFKAEKDLLIAEGRIDLAEKVVHASVEYGDGLGFDILSYDLNEKERYIEVKTTRGFIERPFYLTDNELKFSILNPVNYYIYRLFDFQLSENFGRYYILSGNLNKVLQLKPILYKSIPK